MTESNIKEDLPQPLDTLLVGDLFYVCMGNPSILYKLAAKSDREWVCKIMTGPYAGEYTNGLPTSMCMKQKVH